MRTIFLLLVISTIATAQIKVSDNRRFLADSDNKPFFWLGDTCWELFHRMTREEIDEFLEIKSVVMRIGKTRPNWVRD